MGNGGISYFNKLQKSSVMSLWLKESQNSSVAEDFKRKHNLKPCSDESSKEGSASSWGLLGSAEGKSNCNGLKRDHIALLDCLLWSQFPIWNSGS